MPVPKYYEMQRPFLEALKDGKPHAMKNIVDFIIGYFHLSTEDIAEMLPSGRQSVVRKPRRMGQHTSQKGRIG